MRGIVIGYDPAALTGVIRGADGRRYAFSASGWRSPAQPVAGAEVDFEADEDAASEIYALGGASAPPVAGAGRGFVMRPPLLFASLILVGSFLPLMNAFAYGIVAASAGASLMGVSGLVQFYQAVVAMNEGGGGAAALVNALYLAYLAPLLAVWVIVSELTNRANFGASRAVRVFAGLASMGVPVILVGLTIVSIEGGYGARGAPDYASMIGPGTYVLVGAGFLMLLNVLGIIPNPKRRAAPF